MIAQHARRAIGYASMNNVVEQGYIGHDGDQKQQGQGQKWVAVSDKMEIDNPS